MPRFRRSKTTVDPASSLTDLLEYFLIIYPSQFDQTRPRTLVETTPLLAFRVSKEVQVVSNASWKASAVCKKNSHCEPQQAHSNRCKSNGS